jgi:hypothetical protein
MDKLLAKLEADSGVQLPPITRLWASPEALWC